MATTTSLSSQRVARQACTSRAPPRARAVAVRAAATTSGGRPAAMLPSASSTSQPQQRQPQRRPPSARVLPLLASAVEANAAVLGFERAAGRSAMIGIFSGVLIETARGGAPLLQGGIEAQALGAIALATLGAAAAAVATTARSPAALGTRWREPVVASLTSVRRSNSGVTPSGKLRGLDRAVDEVLRGLSLSLVGGAGGPAGAPGAASRFGALLASSAVSTEEEEAEEAAAAAAPRV